MRTDLIVWGCLALALVAAETLVPGAMLLWLGLAAAAVWALLLAFPMAPLWQVVAFVVLSFVSVGFISAAHSWLQVRNRLPIMRTLTNTSSRPRILPLATNWQAIS